MRAALTWQLRGEAGERQADGVELVEYFRPARTVQGPASKGLLPLIATGP